MKRSTRAAMISELPEVTVGPVLLLAKLIDDLCMTRELLFDANHAEACPRFGSQFYREIKCLSRVIRTIVCNQDLSKHVIRWRQRLRPS